MRSGGPGGRGPLVRGRRCASPTIPANVARRAVRQDLRDHRRGRRRGRRDSPVPTRSASTSLPARRAPSRSTRRRRSPTLARGPASRRPGPSIVLVTADASPALLAEATAAVDPDAIQYSGHETAATLGASPRPAWKVVHVAAEPTTAATTTSRPAAALARGRCRSPARRHGRRPAPGRDRRARRRRDAVAAIAREVPVTLAGGLTPANVAAALREIPAVGVDVASGVEFPRVAGERPTKDPFRVGLFVKRAKAARDDRPNVAFGPTPVHAGLLDADARRPLGDGARLRWALRARDPDGGPGPARDGVRRAPPGPGLLGGPARVLLERFAGRPTAALSGRPPRRGGPRRGGPTRRRVRRRRRLPPLRLYLKREDLAHTGAHKINNALGQALLTRRLGKTRVIAETGAGQHGVATATACALLDLPCVVYMGAEDIERQGPNVLRMRALGAEVRSVTSPGRRRSRTRSTRRCATGSPTSRRRITCSARRWARTRTPRSSATCSGGSATRPRPSCWDVEGRLPDLALACVGGGSNAIGLLARFIGEPTVRLAVAEAAGDGLATGRHAAAILGGTPGILHGSRSLMLQDRDGQVVEAHSASAGLDYPGIGPQLAALAEAGRIEVAAATDREAVAAMKATTRTEGILPALETTPRHRRPAQAARRRRGPRRRLRPVARAAGAARVLGPRRQGPRRADPLRRRRAVGRGAR